ncbi:Glycerol-3-phosphate acyltransferase [Thermus arciformis]|uniref:Glycerol-3-phosphate acyltransferase n=1 Tax=Thermus arciformis TaxID=482827 RepID=A0A1G7EEE0_9DEIN|nr:glycerol-3-phosphate acyltransferase [Thermus arciformis]SDE62023.1 Glycerol-3-phosphate acyltransferase [Thermus arciformis]
MVYLLLAYLLGSLVGGLLLFPEVRGKDLPGGSGVFRRKGPWAALLVVLFDLGKGVLAALLTPPALRPWAGVALVAGHNWPLFFRFRGGGGIAPSLGFFLAWFPRETLWATALGLLVAGVYHLAYWRKGRKGIYPIPFGAAFGYLALLLLAPPEGRWGALGVAGVVALRGLQILKGRW